MGNLLRMIQCDTEQKTFLYQEEKNVIAEMILQEICNNFPSDLSKGTCIIDGQKNGEKAKCLIRFNLADNACSCEDPNEFDEIAEEAINNALLYPKEESLYLEPKLKSQPQKMESGIYESDDLKVLVLNVTEGRFLASFYADFKNGGGHDESTKIMITISEAIAQMGKEDEVLQDSAKKIASDNKGLGSEVVKNVDKLFDECNFPALKAWRKWHEPANSSGELSLFFGEKE